MIREFLGKEIHSRSMRNKALLKVALGGGCSHSVDRVKPQAVRNALPFPHPEG